MNYIEKLWGIPVLQRSSNMLKLLLLEINRFMEVFMKKIRTIIPVVTVFSFLFACDLAAMKKKKREINHEISREINTDASEELSRASFDANNTFKIGEIVIVERSDESFRYGQIVRIEKALYNVLVETPRAVKEGMSAKLIGKLPDGKDEKKEAKKPHEKTNAKKALHSLNGFARLCSTTPEYRGEVKPEDKNPYHPALISQEDIMSLITEFVKRKQSTGFFNDRHWLKTAPSADLFKKFPKTTPESHALPFVQKLDLDLKHPHEVYTVGDIHSSVHSLVRTLLTWKRTGIINDQFEIIKPGCSIVFTGDFVDRGRYGVEVWALLLTLKLANWDLVHLLRGNHEEMSICQFYGFFNEITFKYNSENLFNAFCALYELLPFALFVYSGTNQNGLRVYGQFCHGGLAPEHNLLPLLASKTATYELLDAIDNELFVELGVNDIITAENMLESDPKNNTHWFDGYNWSDFCQEHDNNADAGTIIQNMKRGGGEYGKGHIADVPATAAFLQVTQNKKFHKLNVCLGYFARGHQDQGTCGKLLFRDSQDAANLPAEHIDENYPHGPYDWKHVVPQNQNKNNWISLCNGTHAPIITMSTAAEGRGLMHEGFCIIRLAGKYEKTVFKIIESQVPDKTESNGMDQAPDKDSKKTGKASKKRKKPSEEEQEEYAQDNEEDDTDYTPEAEEEQEEGTEDNNNNEEEDEEEDDDTEDYTPPTKKRKIESKKRKNKAQDEDGKPCTIQ